MSIFHDLPIWGLIKLDATEMYGNDGGISIDQCMNFGAHWCQRMTTLIQTCRVQWVVTLLTKQMGPLIAYTKNRFGFS